MPEPMDEIEIQSWMHKTLTEAIDFVDNDLSPERATAMRYYLGAKFSESEHTPTEKKGSSTYVSREVHDAVHQMLAPIFRILFAGDHVVEFEPRTLEGIEVAKQATDYCDYILKHRNDGYVLLDTVIKDALIKGVGITETFYETKVETRVRELTGIDEATAAAIMQAGEWEVTGSAMTEDGTYNMSLQQVKQDGQVCIQAIPPEEFIVNRNCADISRAKVLARRQRLTVSDLVELGYDYDMVLELADTDDTFKGNEEWLLRNPTFRDEELTEDPSLRELLYIESYVRADFDGDGKTELRKICCIGATHKVVQNKIVDDHPYSVFRMDMLPHDWVGLSVYNEVGDLQRLKSAVIRNQLDSLALSTTPRMLYLDGQVEYNQLANSEVGALIAMRQPGAVQQLDIPYVGAQAQGMVEYLDSVFARRTGLTDASQGLDSDSLQSTTAIAIDGQLKAAQARIELVARNLIETGLKPLYEKMLRLITYHQDQADLMLLRGQYVPVDPSSWPMMQVRVSLPIGAADAQTKTQLLMTVMEKQESLMQLLGPTNGFANIANYHAALQRVLELNGVIEGQTYFNPPDQAMEQMAMEQQQAAEQEGQQKTPEQYLAEAQVQAKQMDILAKAASDAREDDRKRDQMSIDLFLEAEKLKAQYGAQLDLTGLVQELQRNRELEVIQQRTMAQRYQEAIEQLYGQMTQTQPAEQLPEQIPGYN